MKQRLHTLLATEKLTSSKFADLLGVNRSSISHLLSGRNNPSLEFLQKILVKFPHINPDWLLLGQGEMYRNQPQNGAPKPIIGGQLFSEDTLVSNQEKLQVSTSHDSPVETNPAVPLNQTPQETTTRSITKPEEKVLREPEDKTGYGQNAVSPQDLGKTNAESETPAKQIQKIVFFYTDHTFDTYYPNA
jgi:transcriptional regulator with XRE-family HTH domain